MNYNPYAAPGATNPQARELTTPGGGAPQPWDIGEVLSASYEVFKPNWAVLVFTQFLAGLLGAIPMFVPGVSVALRVVTIHSAEYWTIYSVCFVLNMLIASFFQVGLIRIWVTAARGETPQFGDVFNGASRYLPMLGLTFLTLAVMIPLYAMLIVPGVIFGLGISLAQFYAVDQEMGPVDALRASWDATRGHKGQLFLFVLLSVVMTFGGLFACCFGIFVVMPVIYVAMAIIYLRLSGRAVMRAPFGPPVQGGGYPRGGYGPTGGYPPAGYPPPGGPPPGY